MKKTIAILLVLVIGMVGVFASGEEGSEEGGEATIVLSGEATIVLSTTVAQFASFGVHAYSTGTGAGLGAADFISKLAFEGKVSSSISESVDMLTLDELVPVGFLSGINNTSGDVTLYITVSPLTDGTNSVPLLVNVKSKSTDSTSVIAVAAEGETQSVDAAPATINIPGAANSSFGILMNSVISVKEAAANTASTAPAGTYTSTVTITATSV